MSDSVPVRRWRTGLQAGISIVILIFVVILVDEEVLFTRISNLDPAWVALALIVSIPQILFSALRWRLTAERLGISLPAKTAIAEYYLATLTNQLLPGGVLGDAARAVRHGRRLQRNDKSLAYAPAIRAVIYERASGQLVLLLVMLTGFLFWPEGGRAFPEPVTVILLVLLFAALALLLMAKGPFAQSRLGMGTRNILAEMRHALFGRDIVLRQAFYSLAVIGTYLACFYCAARAIGIAMSFADTIALVPAILFSMTLPISIGGWGIREAAAASVWGLAGLTPADGVAVSVTYGIIVLLSALPGVLFILPASKRDIRDHG